MHKLLAFDLDGTLAAVGKGMSMADSIKLIRLEEAGYTIVICSGKPTYYLCGFARQLGLKNPILVGENGAVFQFGIDLPPKWYEVYPYSGEAKKQRNQLKEFIDKKFGTKIWYQPNEVALSPFPKDEETFEQLQELINENKEQLSELLIYRHIDCFDLLPKNINKYNGLKYLVKLLGLSSKDTAAIGDGVNDMPMFEFADIAIGVGAGLKVIYQEKELLDYWFSDITQVLDFIKEKGL